MQTRLFHFSENGSIAIFEPRCVSIPVSRPAGQDWLNGPLVWAIDEAHSFLYLFPRDCPRILVWATSSTSPEDQSHWLGDTNARVVAYVERGWMERLAAASVHRYTLSSNSFQSIDQIGMWVSTLPVTPIAMRTLAHLPRHLEQARVELRHIENLLPLKDVWRSTVHASGIRLRNAIGWGEPGWPHSAQPNSPA